ncbi:MAG: hypothetical protein A2Y34_01640 [Spirochaetes bacterium GWC1_27_15]|nr:MAG: hypothetical protein A2Z98_17420 [Spirochaetes bacterium GWB1_27_13]OHD26636.1 MAG: hypothetical protein A2Y34_01640 [Spirochaetes bacterium GWC1_27_15]
MKKQEIFKEICKLLNIQIDDSFFSSGSKVTKDGFFAVYKKLTMDKFNFPYHYETKQGFFRRICLFLGLTPKDEWLSSGSTIKTEGINAVLEKLKQKIKFESFDEYTLPLTIDNDTQKIINSYDIKNNPHIHFLKLKDLSKEQLKEIVKQRIEQYPAEKYVFLGENAMNKQEVIIEIANETKIGNEFIEIHKIAIDMTFESLNLN